MAGDVDLSVGGDEAHPERFDGSVECLEGTFEAVEWPSDRVCEIVACESLGVGCE